MHLRGSCYEHHVCSCLRVGTKNRKLWNEKKQNAGWDLKTSPRGTQWVRVPFDDLASLLTCLQGSGIDVFENLPIFNPFSFLWGGGILLLSLRQGSQA